MMFLILILNYFLSVFIHSKVKTWVCSCIYFFMATICVNYLCTNISLFIFLVSLCFLNPKEKYSKEPKPVRIFQVPVYGHSGRLQSNRKTCTQNSSISNNFFTTVSPKYYKFKNATQKIQNLQILEYNVGKPNFFCRGKNS